MLLFGKTLGLFSIICILSSLPLECRATLDSEEISTKNIQAGHNSFYLKPSRKVLGVGNSQIIQMSSIDDDKPWFWFCLVIMLILFFLFLVKCCIRLASDEQEEISRVTVHPPPRIQPFIQSYGSSRSPTRINTSSRILTPPRTSSRSLILMPEPGIDQNHHTLYFAIDNPNFNLFTINLNENDRMHLQASNTPSRTPPPSNPPLINLPSTNPPTDLNDPPPDYDSVVTSNQQDDNRTTLAASTPVDFQNSEKMQPPNYEDLHR